MYTYSIAGVLERRSSFAYDRRDDLTEPTGTGATTSMRFVFHPSSETKTKYDRDTALLNDGTYYLPLDLNGTAAAALAAAQRTSSPARAVGASRSPSGNRQASESPSASGGRDAQHALNKCQIVAKIRVSSDEDKKRRCKVIGLEPVQSRSSSRSRQQQ